MRSEWFETTIGAQATLQRGIDITKAAQRPGRVPVVSSGGVSSFHDTAAVRGPGVVLGRKGVVGSVYFINQDFWPHDTSLWVKDFHGNDPRFVYYFFRSIAPQLAALDVGSANPTLNRNHVHPIPVTWPTRQFQRDIAAFLGTLDERIELLRQTNATLESIAQALFKSWFIDFDPVRAKAEGREPEGMDAATAALFPSEFEESALGLIPKGWREGTLADLSTLNAASWSARRAPAVVAYVDLAGVKANVFDLPQQFSFAEAPSRARRELRAGDTIVGTVRPGNRSFGFIAETEPGLTGSTGFAVLSPATPSAATFVYLCATRDESIDRLAALADGGAYPAVRPELVHSTPCALPPDLMLGAFHSVASALLLRIAASTRHARVLSNVRDTLLPRLISGKLRLPEAREQVEAAVA